MSDSLFINSVNMHLFVGVTEGSDLILSFSDLQLSSEAKQVRVWGDGIEEYGVMETSQKA